jgi:hypothetical protein
MGWLAGGCRIKVLISYDFYPYASHKGMKYSKRSEVSLSKEI